MGTADTYRAVFFRNLRPRTQPSANSSPFNGRWGIPLAHRADERARLQRALSVSDVGDAGFSYADAFEHYFAVRDGTPMRRSGRSLANSVQGLKRHASLPREPLFAPQEQQRFRRAHLEEFTARGTRLADPSYQSRLSEAAQPVLDVLRKELGLVPAVPMLVIEGRDWSRPTAATLAGDVLCVSRALMDVCGRLGAAIAMEGPAWMEALPRIVDGSYPLEVPKAKQAEARAEAQAALGFVLGHELTHALKNHTSQGRYSDAEGNELQRFAFAKETQSDLLGVELALRAGHSLRGAAGVLAWRAAVSTADDVSHPTGPRRYARFLRHLEALSGRDRVLYRDGQRTKGTAILDARAQEQLRDLPPVEAVVRAQARLRNAT